MPFTTSGDPVKDIFWSLYPGALWNRSSVTIFNEPKTSRTSPAESDATSKSNHLLKLPSGLVAQLVEQW